jgi:hypothetical protein
MSFKRAAPFSGIAFVVFFVIGVGASDVPSDSASNRTWIAAYSGHGKQLGHLTSGVMLVLAGLALAAFLTYLWTVLAQAHAPSAQSPVALVAAGIAGACIATGGVLMAASAGAALTGSAPLPSAELLRFGNDAGFGMVGVAGMLAVALSIAALALRAHAAGVFSRRMLSFSLIVAVLQLGSFEFVPILGVLAWTLVVAIRLLRGSPGVAKGAHESAAALS